MHEILPSNPDYTPHTTTHGLEGEVVNLVVNQEVRVKRNTVQTVHSGIGKLINAYSVIKNPLA